MAITINGSGTIGGVSVGGLPDGIVDTDMLASGAITDALLPAGSVLQVVFGDHNGTFTSTSSTLAMGSTSITPSSTSSKILVCMAGHAERQGGGTGNYVFLDLKRNGTVIKNDWSSGLLYQVANNARGVATAYCLDSPSSTSSVTYSYVGDFVVSGNVPWRFYTLDMLLMEIAA
jgi:hypothetical protein